MKIQGFNTYSISKEGIVTNDEKQRPLKPKKGRGGYHIVRIKGINMAIARLVAMAYIPNPENKPEVNHINGVVNDNRVENLEWVTKKEQMLHSYHVLGTNSFVTYNEERLVSIIAIDRAGKESIFQSILLAGKALNINPGHIHNCIHTKTKTGNIKTAKGYTFRLS